MKNIFTNFKVLLLIGVILFVGSSQNVFAQTSTSTSNQATILDLKNNLRLKSTDAKTNGEVSLLQNFLKVNGYSTLKPTGIFGKATLKAVKSFQKANGFKQNGFVGPLTRAKIKSLTLEQKVKSPIIISNVKTKSTTDSITVTFDTNILSYGGVSLSLKPENKICADYVRFAFGVGKSLLHNAVISGLCPDNIYELNPLAYLSLGVLEIDKTKVYGEQIKVKTTK